MFERHRRVGWLAVPAVVAASWAAWPVLAQRPAGRVAPAKGVGVTTETGLQFRLSEAPDEGAPRGERPPAPPAASPLAPEAASEVLDRLPPLPPEPTPVPFARREDSLPPPRPGATVKEPFPPPVAPPAPDAPAAPRLEVARRSPEGEVPLAANVSVTFSQPMVDVTSHGELAREAAPLRLQPQPEGRWRWVGTRTLLFEAAGGRMPMATTYTLEVPAGTRSAVGGVLAEAVRWTLGTPPPSLVSSYPGSETVRRDTLLFAAFDQRIDADAVLSLLTVRAGGAALPLRRASAAEVAADERIKTLADRAGEGRWLAFRTQEPLPADAQVTATVPAGTPSAEGPRRTVKAQSWSFRTFGPLRLVEHQCGWNKQCPPGTPWRARFSNAIDAAAFDPEMVRVSPELPARAVDVHGEWLFIRGRARGRTAYTVTFAPELRDVFGQTLGTPAKAVFTTTAAPRFLTATSSGLVVLDPGAPPRFSVWSVNHPRLKVAVHAVTPSDWPAYMAFQQEHWRNLKGATPPGRRVIDTTLAVRADPDEMVETRIDLAPALPRGVGHLVVMVEPATPSPPEQGIQRVLAWVQSTQIGLAAFADQTELLGWASALADGAPLPGVELELVPAGVRAATGADGTARLALADRASYALVARRGEDVALLPAHPGWYDANGGWRKSAGDRGLRWLVFDDRGMYRPGEDVRLKGWVRAVGLGKGGDLEPWSGSPAGLAYALRDAQGNEIVKGRAELSPHGGFELSLKLPPTMNLGQASVLLEADEWSGSPHGHSFQVQEFRRPEYEVTAAASQAPHFVGGAATVTVSAQYYAGGSLSDAPVNWRVAASETTYRPPNRDAFVFGRWRPWWEFGFGPTPQAPERVRTMEGRTDAGGRHRLRVDFDRADPPLPSSVRAEATVTDVNRQAWTATVNLLVHPADVYVGLRTAKPFVERGARFTVDTLVTDLDGTAVAGRPVEVKAERLEWRHGAKGWQEEAVPAGSCTITSGADVVPCALTAGEGGQYRISAIVRDAQGRANLSETRLWVAGGRMPEGRGLEQEKVTLVPGKQEYRPGETAEVLVVAPFLPAEGLMTVRRSGLVRSQRFRMTESTHALRIPIEERDLPNVHVQVDLVGVAPRDEEPGRSRPAFASGTVTLRVPPLSRSLGVKVAPRAAALEPGGSTTLDVTLTDAQGRPAAAAEVALVVVDEAVLALTGYTLPDPLAVFYTPREPGVSDHHLRSSVVLGSREVHPYSARGDLSFAVAEQALPASAPPPPAAAPAVRMKGRAGGGAAPQPIRMRTDFTPLALFEGRVVTDASGRAQVPLKVPDSLTRYRVMAVAATRGVAFGSSESTLTVRLPLMVRPSPPRFLNFGDRFELPVVVQNQTDSPMTVDVAVRAQGLSLTAGAGRRVQVPASDRVEVRFPMAVERVGMARVQVGASANGWADAAEVSLPVWTPATTEAFATYGQVDQGAVVQPVRPPADVFEQFGGLEVTTSSTALQALTDAVLYLVSYPFECSEQLSSRVLGIAALRDVLTAFQAEGLPEPKEMEAAVQRDLDLLRRLQNSDGGFPFWRRGEPSWPYVTIHVANAMERAKAKGFTVPGPMLESAQRYLKDIDRHIPKDTPDSIRRTLVAYALNVRHRLGDSDGARARRLFTEAAGVKGLSFEAQGWVLPVLAQDPAAKVYADAIRRHLANNVAETAAAAHFAVSYGEAGEHLLLHSDRRADAVILEALIGDQPKSDLIPKLVEGLLGHRRAGRWLNTQENVFVLLAMDRYFNAYEKVTPDFVARLWLGERFVGEHAYRGRTTDRHLTEVPMATLMEQGRSDLLLSKDGAGRLYYRIGMRYAPRSLRLEPMEQGFAVERVYESVDDPADVRRDPDGTWHIRSGARVRVRLTMVAPGRRHHVALVDPLPAGLEALNPVLATTGTLPERPPDTVDVMGASGLGGPRGAGHWWWWRRTWYEHQNLRDERVEAFASLLFEGVYTYSYVARATTPGTFVVPPTKAEEMYHPETFGRGGTDRVVVE